MDVKINSGLVRAERENKAWSQQHLADVTGLSLRTIQRIELNGVASYESIHALASCLDLSVTELRRIDDPNPVATCLANRWKTVATSISALTIAGMAIITLQSAFAEQVLVDLGVSIEGQDEYREYESQVLLESGEPTELEMDGNFSIHLTPTVLESGRVVLALSVYDYREEEYKLLGEPRVMTAGGKEAEIHLGSKENGNREFKIVITPNVQ